MSHFLRTHLMYSTAVAALMVSSESADAYIVNGFAPPVVADFAGVLNSGTEYYRVGGSDSTFDSMFTFSRSGNATMVDSDGNLKWAPHNLCLQSEDFSTTWLNISTTDSTNAAVAPDGATTADEIIVNASQAVTASGSGYFTGGDGAYQFISPAVVGQRYTYELYIKQATTFDAAQIRVNSASSLAGTNYASVIVDLTDGTKVAEGGSWLASSTVVDCGSGWYKVTATFDCAATNFYIGVWQWNSTTIGATAGTESIYVWGGTLYYSSLGGMVDNPNQTNSNLASYVQTTTAAVYQARRNHHRFNGSTYDNKGILLESEARTNLCAQSSDLTTTWFPSNTDSITVTSNAGVGADGASSLDKLEITDTTNEDHTLIFQNNFTINTIYTCAVTVRDVDQQYVTLVQYGGGNYWAAATFDLTNETSTEQVGSSGGTVHSSSITELASGLYRIVLVSEVPDNGGTDHWSIGFANAATPSLDSLGRVAYAGTAGVGFYAGEVQIEQAATPSSYIPTSGATVTRAAETLTIPWANTSWSDTADSYQMQGEVSYVDNNDGVEVGLFQWYVSGSDLWAAWLDTDRGTGGIQYRLRDGATLAQDILSSGSAFTPGINKAYNIASRITETGPAFNAALNGTSFTVNTGTPDLPLFSVSNPDIKLGTVVNVAADNGHFGTIALFRQWDADIGDTGIESATS